MSVTDQIRKVVSEQFKALSRDADFLALEAFYEAAKRDGIAKAPEYDLPQVDTIGRLVRPAD
jgi:hypothetical protein